MSTPSPSSLQKEIPLPPDPHRRKPPPARPRRKNVVFLKLLAALAMFVLLLAGCAGPQSPLSRFIIIEEVPPSTAVAMVEPTFTPEPTSTPTITPTASPSLTPTPPPTATSPPAIIYLTPTSTPTPVSQSEINHVVIISIDGLRPDALDLAYTPILDNLRDKGSYCPQAQTVKMSETLPGHASMLTGMIPEKHGVVWGLPYIGWPGMNGPTLFNVAHDAGLSTGMVFGKDKMHHLIIGDSIDKLYGADVHDTEIKIQAIKFIQAGLPNVFFIHFPDTDRVGHAFGWMSENQFQAITYVDSLIGEVVAALDQGGYLERTLIIVSSDHGGHGFVHGDDSPIDRTIPWLAVGPGVPAGVILSGHIDTFDTAATVLYVFDLPIPEGWDGQPVMEIFQ